MKCIICHKLSNRLTRYSCGHFSHGHCMQKWKDHLIQNKGTNFLSCPYCRQRIKLYRRTRANNYKKPVINYIYELVNKLELKKYKKHGTCHGCKRECENYMNLFLWQYTKDKEWYCMKCLDYDETQVEFRYSINEQINFIKHIFEFAWKNRVTVRKIEYLRIALIGQAERVFEKDKNKKFLDEHNVNMKKWAGLCQLSRFIKSRI